MACSEVGSIGPTILSSFVMIRRMCNSTKNTKTRWSWPMGRQCPRVLDQIGHYKKERKDKEWSEKKDEREKSMDKRNEDNEK